MTNRATRLRSIRDFIVANIGEHHSDVGSLVATEFNMSRQAANKHLRRLTEAGVLENLGNTRAREYSLAVLDGNTIEIAVTPELAEHEVWMEHIFHFLVNYPGMSKTSVNLGSLKWSTTLSNILAPQLSM